MSEPRARITHELKIWPEYFNEVRGGRMKFQLRRNDRDYRVGDELLLKEWDPTVCYGHRGEACEPHYTSREVKARVDYLMTAADVAGFGYRGISPIDRGYVIMSISLIS